MSKHRFAVNFLQGGRDLTFKEDTPVELLVFFGLCRFSVCVREVCVTACVCIWFAERRDLGVEETLDKS